MKNETKETAKYLLLGTGLGVILAVSLFMVYVIAWGATL